MLEMIFLIFLFISLIILTPFVVKEQKIKDEKLYRQFFSEEDDKWIDELNRL